MNKYLGLITGLLAITTILVGCIDIDISKFKEDISIESNENTELDIENEKLEDYYPFLENTVLEYKGIGNEFAEQEMFFEFVEGDKAQLKVSNPGTTMITILERSNGELKEIFSEGEFYYNENMIGIEDENPNILLKEPLRKGTSWTLDNGNKRSITRTDLDIKLPYKDLKALEVTTELDDDIKQYDYYVKNIGHVASIYKDGEFEVKTILKDIREEALKKEVFFYYPKKKEIGIMYIENNIEISTNEGIKKTLESNFKDPGSRELLPIISKRTKINSIELDRGSKIVSIDFSKELERYVIKHNLMEGEILESIVNTLGYYYGVDKVYISIDGLPYKTDNFSMEEDEYFSLDKRYIEEFN